MSLRAGEIRWVVFDPIIRTEQGGRRPAIILSNESYNDLYPRSIVCPISRNPTPWPTKVILPDVMKAKGAVLADQPRTVHREGRSFRFIEQAPDELLARVVAIVSAIIGTRVATR